ncbi:hypothetical protein B0H21DRAFT_163059 [Amylocystis lapponica]|nr:hypothetical protein B0H21DRAFT_163059 [Amylocystis lapponica]
MLAHGFDVSISCEGKTLSEYDVQLQDDKTVVCYIPSETGKKFKICWRYVHGQASTSVRSHIDGRSMGGQVCNPGEKGDRWGVRTSLTARKPFEFSPLVLTDDDNLTSPAGAHPDLGTVKVEIYRVVRLGHATMDSMQFGPVAEVGPVHEKSKKAGAHCVALGDAQRCKPAPRTRVRNLDPPGSPLVQFVFRYRPRDLLQAQGIMPLVPGENQPSSSTGSIRKRAAETSSQGSKSMKRRKSGPYTTQEDTKPSVDGLSQSARTGSNSSHGKKDTKHSQHVKNEPRTARLNPTKEDVIDLTLED